MPKIGEIDREVNQKLVPQQLALNEKFQELRSEIGALTYEIETTRSESGKNSLRAKIDKGFEAPLLHTVRGAGYMIRAHA